MFYVHASRMLGKAGLYGAKKTGAFGTKQIEGLKLAVETARGAKKRRCDTKGTSTKVLPLLRW
jgi:hypothetical protein